MCVNFKNNSEREILFVGFGVSGFGVEFLAYVVVSFEFWNVVRFLGGSFVRFGNLDGSLLEENLVL